VTARVSGGNMIRARYLAGCDGAHSVARHGTGLKFKGAPYPQDFILADVKIDWERPEDQLALFLARKGLIAAFPFGRGLFRLIASRSGARASRRELRHAEIGAGQQAEDPPKLEEFEEAFARFTPFRPRLHDPKWLARFRLHHRAAERYSRGRVFLAGDAAHIHSPVGGQGMNTGIQDAANLGWKLAMVIRGEGDERLLDSYDAERRPIGRRLLHFTDRAFAIATIHTPVIAAVRDFVLAIMIPRIMSSRERRRRAFRFVSQLAIRYDKSPIVGKGAGWRAPDAPLNVDGKETTLFELTRELRHHVVIFRGDTVRIDDIEAVDARGIARRRYGVTGSARFVIRPDGYVQ
jgi:2-polyprenyl-6-methoxyphenol hydroxylase-like FAD-dependent oxidoreductase